jgi:hypothetical protein
MLGHVWLTSQRRQHLSWTLCCIALCTSCFLAISHTLCYAVAMLAFLSCVPHGGLQHFGAQLNTHLIRDPGLHATWSRVGTVGWQQGLWSPANGLAPAAAMADVLLGACMVASSGHTPADGVATSSYDVVAEYGAAS